VVRDASVPDQQCTESEVQRTATTYCCNWIWNILWVGLTAEQWSNSQESMTSLLSDIESTPQGRTRVGTSLPEPRDSELRLDTCIHLPVINVEYTVLYNTSSKINIDKTSKCWDRCTNLLWVPFTAHQFMCCIVRTATWTLQPHQAFTIQAESRRTHSLTLTGQHTWASESHQVSHNIFHFPFLLHKLKTKLNSVALVRERTIPTERQPLVGEDSANVCG
jgi:hypothetical protein